MTNNKKPQKTLATQQSLKDAFIKLYQEYPLEKITVKEITSKAGFTRSTFYLYYEDVYNLLEEIENELLEAVDRISTGFTTHVLAKYRIGDPYPFLSEFFCFFRSKREYYLAMLGPYGDPLFLHKWRTRIKVRFIGLLDYNRIDYKDSDFVAELIANALLSSIRYWLSERNDISPEEFSILMGQALFGGYGYPKCNSN